MMDELNLHQLLNIIHTVKNGSPIVRNLFYLPIRNTG